MGEDTYDEDGGGGAVESLMRDVESDERKQRTEVEGHGVIERR